MLSQGKTMNILLKLRTLKITGSKLRRMFSSLDEGIGAMLPIFPSHMSYSLEEDVTRKVPRVTDFI